MQQSPNPETAAQLILLVPSQAVLKLFMTDQKAGFSYPLHVCVPMCFKALPSLGRARGYR